MNQRERRPGWDPDGADLVGNSVNRHDTRRVVSDPAMVRLLATVVPCPLCEHGLCGRCWVVARTVEHLVIAQRRDQAVETAVAA